MPDELAAVPLRKALARALIENAMLRARMVAGQAEKAPRRYELAETPPLVVVRAKRDGDRVEGCSPRPPRA
jgi:hypothetical protein